MELVMDGTIPQTAENDAALLARISRGDGPALEDIYRMHGQRLFAFALKITGENDLAEEAVQETLLAVWQGARHYRGESRVIVWLLGILNHKALNLVRRAPAAALEEIPAELRDEGPLPEETAEAGDDRIRLRNAMNTLSPEHRIALELVFYQGLSLEETAAVCACPVGTIKSRLNTAKQNLRGVLKRSGGEPEEGKRYE